VRNDDTLPQQHFLVFRVPEAAKAPGTVSPAP
jgi:hypothetical protein